MTIQSSVASCPTVGSVGKGHRVTGRRGRRGCRGDRGKVVPSITSTSSTTCGLRQLPLTRLPIPTTNGNAHSIGGLKSIEQPSAHCTHRVLHHRRVDQVVSLHRVRNEVVELVRVPDPVVEDVFVAVAAKREGGRRVRE